MLIVSDLSGQNTPVIRKYSIYGAAADLYLGSLVEQGAAAASLGAVCVSASPPTMVLGLLTQLHDYSVVGDWTYTSLTAAANLTARGDVDIRPFAIYRAEVDVCGTQTITIAASLGSGAGAVTLNTTCAQADELTGGYLYNATTDELKYIETHDAAATAVLATNIGTTAWASKACTIVPPMFYGMTANTGLTLDSTLCKVICEGNGTGAWCKVIGSYIQNSSRAGLDPLLPWINDNTTPADAKFFVDFVVIKHALNT